MTSRIRRFITHPAVKGAYLVLLLAVTAAYLLRWGNRLPDLIGQVRPIWLGAAFALACLSALLYSYIQYDIYHHLGVRPTYGTIFRVVTISQLGKYLPGKLLFFGNFYLFSREAGIGAFQIGANFAISMALWLLTATLCSLPVLSLLEPSLRYLVLILPLLLALLIHPRFLGWFLEVTRRIAERMRGPLSAVPVSSAIQSADTAEFSPVPLSELGVSFYLRTALLYLATWALAGLGTYCCLAALGPVGLDLYPLALASIALGTVAGFLALFAPVGLGIREGIGTLILSPFLGADIALLGMLLMRGISVIVDLLLALLALAIGHRFAPVASLKE